MHIDNRYIIGLRQNNTAIIDEIYKKYYQKIVLFITKNNGDENDAADIFQDALLYIYNRAFAQNFCLTCPFDAYIYMVCKNRWLNALEKRKNTRVTLVEDGGFNINIAQQDGIAEMQQKENKLLLIDAAVGNIGEGCANLLKLSWQGLGMEEVGIQLNMTYAYVRKKKSECMGKLIALIKKEPNYKLLLQL